MILYGKKNIFQQSIRHLTQQTQSMLQMKDLEEHYCHYKLEKKLNKEDKEKKNINADII